MPIYLNDVNDSKPNVIAAGRSGFYFAKRVYDFLAISGEADDFSLIPMQKYDEKKGKTIDSHYDFADGIPHVELAGNVRRRKPYVFQCFETPDYFARDLLELYVILDAIDRAHGDASTVVLPYYPGRGDKKDEPRSEIFASLLARQLENLGIHGGITMDMHAGQIQGFFQGPFDHVYADPLFLMYLRKMIKENGMEYDDVIVASPDAGSAKSTKRFAESLYGEPRMALVMKDRRVRNEVTTSGIIGDVDGKAVIFRDDIGDTMGTIVAAAAEAYNAGAKKVMACITHPLLSPKDGVPAEEKIAKCGLKIITTNTTPRGEKYLLEGHPHITVLDASPIFAAAVARDSRGKPIRSALTEEYVRQLYEETAYPYYNKGTAMHAEEGSFSKN